MCVYVMLAILTWKEGEHRYEDLRKKRKHHYEDVQKISVEQYNNLSFFIKRRVATRPGMAHTGVYMFR